MTIDQVCVMFHVAPACKIDKAFLHPVMLDQPGHVLKLSLAAKGHGFGCLCCFDLEQHRQPPLTRGFSAVGLKWVYEVA